jgi:hypothetical protein
MGHATTSLSLRWLGSCRKEREASYSRGVGRWTAEYVLLRGLGRVHVFPGDDVGARNNLRRWLRLKRTLDYEGVRRVLARWSSHAGLVYFHLLLDRLAEAGYLGDASPQERDTSVHRQQGDAGA